VNESDQVYSKNGYYLKFDGTWWVSDGYKRLAEFPNDEEAIEYINGLEPKKLDDEKCYWGVNDSVGYSGYGTFLLYGGRYKRCFYYDADEMTRDDANRSFLVAKSKSSKVKSVREYYPNIG